MQACVAKSIDASSISFPRDALDNRSVMSTSTIMDCEKVAIRNDPIVTILTTLLAHRSRIGDASLSLGSDMDEQCGPSGHTPWTVRVNGSTSTDSLIEVSARAHDVDVVTHIVR